MTAWVVHGASVYITNHVAPLHEIIEVKLKESRWFQKYCYDGGDYLTRAGKLGMYVMRAVVVMELALVASYVPAFGVFTSLVGSTVLPSPPGRRHWMFAFCLVDFFLLAMVLTTPSLELQGILATFILDCCLGHRTALCFSLMHSPSDFLRRVLVPTGGGTKSFHPLSYSGLLELLLRPVVY
ncbi:hypothetical protein CK203_091009 [Vitis vinifera]|uniref:Uncharacterized protein n=1 Tax=Vitis vinifera TaxID=29760 RepID=A0A438CM45_VITVI|nr:hypothetical protein CK203_091009 [Vitis vinifera]